MTFFEPYLIGLGISMAFMTALWLVSLAVRDSSIVDIFWGAGFVVLAITYALLGHGVAGRQVLIVTLTAIWGLRLSIHIGRRNWGHGEDPRYANWREQAGNDYWWVSFFRVFLLQGVVMWIISAPLLAAQIRGEPGSISALDIVGVMVWLVGFAFESIGDYQLSRFKADPANKGKVMDKGLWAYTRHPNYFGDATVWWGLYLIAAGTPQGYWMIFAPALMSFLLVRVSGVAMLERSQKKSKPGYEDYVNRTSAFIPWPPKRSPRSIGGEAA